MKKLTPVRLGLSILFVSIFCAAQQAMACAFCYGAKDGKSTEHMAVAIWFLFGAIMSVLGGIGAVGYQIYRHSHMPLEPHQELTEQDLEDYD
jgi:putative Mn2+ efflux pump MntP